MNIANIYEQFPTNDDCVAHIEKIRWGGTPNCPYCNSGNSTPMPDEKRHHCNNCNTSFSVTVGTIFHHTHLPLQKWFLAITFFLNTPKRISSRQLGHCLQVNKDTAWRMTIKIGQAMTHHEQRGLLMGIVENGEIILKPVRGK